RELQLDWTTGDDALESFRSIYDGTMRRLEADEFYLFPAAYYPAVGRGLGVRPGPARPSSTPAPNGRKGEVASSSTWAAGTPASTRFSRSSEASGARPIHMRLRRSSSTRSAT